MPKTVLRMLAILCAWRDFAPFGLLTDWKAILRHDIWQKSAINLGNSHPRLWILPHCRFICQNCPVANESDCSKKGLWSVSTRFLRRLPTPDDAKVYAMNWRTC